MKTYNVTLRYTITDCRPSEQQESVTEIGLKVSDMLRLSLKAGHPLDEYYIGISPPIVLVEACT